jgi:hypothetical protein
VLVTLLEVWRRDARVKVAGGKIKKGRGKHGEEGGQERETSELRCDSIALVSEWRSLLPICANSLIRAHEMPCPPWRCLQARSEAKISRTGWAMGKAK